MPSTPRPGTAPAWKTEPDPEEVKLTHLLGDGQGERDRHRGPGPLVRREDRQARSRLAGQQRRPTQGYGRGVLAARPGSTGRAWDPRSTILDQASGLKAEPPIRLQETYQCEGGNLAVGDGYLIVAQAGSLVVFCQNSRLIDRYRDEIARAPDQAINYYRLAQAAEAIGRDDVALSSLGDRPASGPADRRASTAPADRLGDPRPPAAAPDEARTEGQAAAKDWAEAARGFASARRGGPTDRDRLAARLELAEVRFASGDGPGRRGDPAIAPGRRAGSGR